MQCPGCGFENHESLKFCNQCGTSLSGHCVECGCTHQPGSKFCGACGTSLTAQWSAGSSPTQAATEPGLRCHALVPMVIALLRGEKRVTHRALKDVLGLDDALLEEIREELTFRRLAIDEDGKGLVWTGEAQPAVQPAVSIPSHPTTAETTAVVSSPAAPMPPLETEALTPSHGSTVLAETKTTGVLRESRLPRSPHTVPQKPNGGN